VHYPDIDPDHNSIMVGGEEKKHLIDDKKLGRIYKIAKVGVPTSEQLMLLTTRYEPVSKGGHVFVHGCLGYVELDIIEDAIIGRFDNPSCYTSSDGSDGGCKGDKRGCVLFEQGKCDIAEFAKKPINMKKVMRDWKKRTIELSKWLPGD
jgi:hypothetical protein